MVLLIVISYGHQHFVGIYCLHLKPEDVTCIFHTATSDVLITMKHENLKLETPRRKWDENKVTLYVRFHCPRLRVSADLFQFHEEHRCPTHGQRIKLWRMSTLSWAFSPTRPTILIMETTNKGVIYLSENLRVWYIFSFYPFSWRWLAGANPPCMTEVTFILRFWQVIFGSTTRVSTI